MKFKNEFNSIVIVGNWNNSIFNKDWVAKYLLPNEELKIEVASNLNILTRVSTEELRIFPLAGKLNFSILKQTDQVFRKIAELALKTSDYLIHTPVNSFGINFTFESNDLENVASDFSFESNKLFEELNYNLAASEIKRVLKKDNYVLNLLVTKLDTVIVYDFNYHFEIKSLSNFKSIFEKELVISLKNNSLNLLEEIYSLKLE